MCASHARFSSAEQKKGEGCSGREMPRIGTGGTVLTCSCEDINAMPNDSCIIPHSSFNALLVAPIKRFPYWRNVCHDERKVTLALGVELFHLEQNYLSEVLRTIERSGAAAAH